MKDQNLQDGISSRTLYSNGVEVLLIDPDGAAHAGEHPGGEAEIAGSLLRGSGKDVSRVAVDGFLAQQFEGERAGEIEHQSFVFIALLLVFFDALAAGVRSFSASSFG